MVERAESCKTSPVLKMSAARVVVSSWASGAGAEGVRSSSSRGANTPSLRQLGHWKHQQDGLWDLVHTQVLTYLILGGREARLLVAML